MISFRTIFCSSPSLYDHFQLICSTTTPSLPLRELYNTHQYSWSVLRTRWYSSYPWWYFSDFLPPFLQPIPLAQEFFLRCFWFQMTFHVDLIYGPLSTLPQSWRPWSGTFWDWVRWFLFHTPCLMFHCWFAFGWCLWFPYKKQRSSLLIKCFISLQF